MRFLLCFSLGCITLALTGCHDTSTSSGVLSERYVHKYGYALTKAEWDAKEYPGQVITVLSDGTTVTATYEGGVLHGPTTRSYPHSQTVAHYTLYNQGESVKEVHYDPTGMPSQEWVRLSPSRYSVSKWYHDGSPMLVEEYAGKELIEAQYFTLNNEIESQVNKGAGIKLQRNSSGLLLAKETIERGYCLKRETFYPNGTPETIAFYHRNLLHGERRAFASSGEPLAIEEWVNGKLHGTATYFKNGNRYLEISYLYGQKNGPEKHYIDGDILSQQISWENDQKHGPVSLFIDGKEEKQWFYLGQSVSQRRFAELSQIDQQMQYLDTR